MPTISKIGIIQNAPLTADLSGNLRQIVQGYRECLDHGAQLVIAAGDALCGHELLDLARRRSFLLHTRAALSALSQELGDVPLLLGAYTFLLDEGSGEIDEDSETTHPLPVPYLIEHDHVMELPEAEISDILGMKVYIDLDNLLVLPDPRQVDLMIRLPMQPWHPGSETEETRMSRWQARNCNAPIVYVHSVGTADGKLFAGGSHACLSQGKNLGRMPFFEAKSKVFNFKRKKAAETLLPTREELLCLALQRGIYDTVRNCGYSGICLDIDQKNAAILAALCIQALGRENVWALTFQHKKNRAEALGIRCKEIELDYLAQSTASLMGGANNAELRTRLAACMQMTLSEQRGLMMISSLSRNNAMLGEFTLYGESCGILAPFGNLYENEIDGIRRYLSSTHFPGLSKIPYHAENDTQHQIIRDLVDRNLPPSALLEGLGSRDYRENDVRFIQRKIAASAYKRSQLPLTLQLEPEDEHSHFPLSHRLND